METKKNVMHTYFTNSPPPLPVLLFRVSDLAGVDPDPTFFSNMDPDPTFFLQIQIRIRPFFQIRIRIRNPAGLKNALWLKGALSCCMKQKSSTYIEKMLNYALYNQTGVVLIYVLLV